MQSLPAARASHPKYQREAEKNIGTRVGVRATGKANAPFTEMIHAPPKPRNDRSVGGLSHDARHRTRAAAACGKLALARGGRSTGLDRRRRTIGSRRSEPAPCPCGACTANSCPQCGQCPACAKQKAPECACQKAKKAAELKAKVAGAYKPVFYNNDFSYLEDPCYTGWMLGDSLKRVAVTPWATVDVGGRVSAHYHNEHNHRSVGPALGLTGADDEFLLHRTRLFANAKYGDNLRVYAEYIDAESNYENFAAAGDRSQSLRHAQPVRRLEVLRQRQWRLTLRFGRQELLYGNQRLVSPLDWANTRRTFEGGKLMWAGEDWNVDAFYTRPVIVDTEQLRWPRLRPGVHRRVRHLQGAVKDRTLDFYYLRYNTPGFQFDTWGTRLLTTSDEWLFEVEGAAQTGDFGGLDHLAGATTVGVGRNMSDGFDWNPVLWAYYDYAAGDDTIGNGFHHLFPLSHRYFGFMDLFGRRNIGSINVQLTMKPHERVKLLAWYYYLWLENKTTCPTT